MCLTVFAWRLYLYIAYNVSIHSFTYSIVQKPFLLSVDNDDIYITISKTKKEIFNYACRWFKLSHLFLTHQAMTDAAYGRIDDAKTKGRIALGLNIFAILSYIAILLGIIVVVSTSVGVSSSSSSSDYYYYYYHSYYYGWNEFSSSITCTDDYGPLLDCY